jgi:hypothetical protein
MIVPEYDPSFSGVIRTIPLEKPVRSSTLRHKPLKSGEAACAIPLVATMLPSSNALINIKNTPCFEARLVIKVDIAMKWAVVAAQPVY